MIKLFSLSKNVETSKKGFGIVTVSAILALITGAREENLIMLEKVPLRST